MIDIEQRVMVGIQIRTYLWMDTGRTLALVAFSFILSTHGIHVGTRTSQVTQIPFEIGHFRNSFHFFENAFLATAHDELSLMRTDGAEGTSAKASAMEIHGELDHIECRYALPFIFRVRQTGIRQVERHIQFALCHRRVGRIHYDGAITCMLQDACRFVFVGFLFNELEVFRFLFLVTQTRFMRVKHDVFLLADGWRNGLFALHYIYGLRYVGWYARILFHPFAEFRTLRRR